ncbi:hypothetical protein MM_3368 [Methanosarcina mazei Go1]|uniref:Uncharacterized protein n=1 Tax=Methanosarcina mazei (strain ATCC BAA-159 / DSM 3647 / Goe1 / Go1 / JCM 11833 / OCM 88) TaxID=192952 RepID=Q8PRS5_METMA|nr:hypothetical protein MM_3368 [Methanosarcina mazei Go1]
MDLAHEYFTPAIFIRSLFVSILVLVDLAHEFGCVRSRIGQPNSFNPCFSGSCSRISQLLHES